MRAFSPADGFLDVKEGVDEMIKYLANEPSLGLFFVQQHAHASMPLLLDVRDKVVEEVHEVTLHTEDIEDSISVVQSMSEYGLPIVDEMIKDINKSLLIMSTTQPKRGLILNPSPSWGFQSSRSSRGVEESPMQSGQKGGGSGRGYLSAILDSAKQKASSLRWSQPGPVLRRNTSENSLSSVDPQPSELGFFGPISTPPEARGDELPVSSHLESDAVAGNSYRDDASAAFENYDKFRSEQELKLKEWLQQPERSQYAHNKW
ncbi:uncharacterized protein LOC109727251 [Ananas comosus]|uniref:Uncharacterized protein LOC109727251 n=1 Tax=Ananas comosus TaxID=4615 RepID=A0A6P5H6Y3_ANACO|nr:uncharacterized protein LOC109727251 [Ananas comosus]